MTTPEELQKRIEQLRAEIAEVTPGHTVATATIAAKQSEIFVLASQLSDFASRRVERQTQQLIWLTWALVALTVALLFYTVLLYQDAKEQKQHAHLTHHHAQQHSFTTDQRHAA